MSQLHSTRTHDRDLYLGEDRYEEPKEMFKSLVELVRQSGGVSDGARVCDLGCAAGEFLYHLQRQFPEGEYHGYDVVPELLAKARRLAPAVEFGDGSVLDRELLPAASFDLTFMLGVHCIFDEFETSLGNLLHWTRPGGRAYVFGPFNPQPADVWVKYRLCSDSDPDHREPGWNIFSRQSVAAFLDRAVGEGRHRFVPFELPLDLPPHGDDPARSWTFRDESGRRLLRNGLSLLLTSFFIEISV